MDARRVQDQYGVEHRVPRFRRTAGHAGDRAVIDAIAPDLGLDPLDVRKANLYGRDANVTPYGQTVEDHDVAPADRASSSIRAAIAARARDRRLQRALPILKRGIALTPVKFGISFTLTHINQAGALVHVYQDGTVHLNHGGTEMGQGLFQKVAQVAAEEFGIGLDRVHITATVDRQSAEHVGHRGVVRHRPQRQGGAGGGAADQVAAWPAVASRGLERAART